jgi:hypothetical protein
MDRKVMGTENKSQVKFSMTVDDNVITNDYFTAY